MEEKRAGKIFLWILFVLTAVGIGSTQIFSGPETDGYFAAKVAR